MVGTVASLEADVSDNYLHPRAIQGLGCDIAQINVWELKEIQGTPTK